MQAIFRMGVPVTGKNVFPSNIQGLPTWYEIRVNKNGYTARTPHFDLMVALNAATYAKDVAEVRSGGYLMFDSSWPLDDKLKRPDVTYLGIPLAEMCNATFKGVRERILMKNIAYAGALAALIGMDTEIIATLTKEKYAAKQSLLDSNAKAIALGYDYAKSHFDCPLPIHLEKMDATKDSILIDGNTAAALGAVYAGATVGAWYPITPATSVMEAFKSFCMKFRRDPETKQKKFAILQAEDELAALGMVVGASWAGARAFTPTAGPGISLMNEFIGLAYYAEIPAVIVDVQRTGPVNRHADAHATRRSDAVRLRVTRRHAAHLPLSGGSRGSVRDGGQGVRSRRAVPDAGVPGQRSRHRHERLDGAEAEMGRQLQARSRQGAVGGGSREGQEFLALLRRGRRRHSAALAAGRASEGRVLHARLGPQQATAATPRTPTNTRRCSTASPGRSRARPGRCRRRSSSRRRARRWAWSPSAAATPPAWKRWICSPRTASR